MKKRQAIKIRKRILQDDDPGRPLGSSERIPSKGPKGVIDQYKRTTNEKSWGVFEKLSKEKRRYFFAKWMGEIN